MRAIVVSVNEAVLTARLDEDDPLHTNHGQRIEAAARSWFLQWRAIRTAYLGHHRLFRYLRAQLRMTLPLDSGWTWNADRKLWRYAGLERRELVSLPSYRQEAGNMARSYFAARMIRPDAADLISSTLAGLAKRADALVVLISPSERMFQEDADAIAPGFRPRVLDVIRNAASRNGARTIDCSTPETCGVAQAGFADPVHLNDLGVAAYSRALAPLIAAALR